MGIVKNDGLKDPYPVNVPGVAPILSYKVEEYVNDEFLYYYNFYISCKHAGLPFNKDWTEIPAWVTQLIIAFDRETDMDKRMKDYKFQAQIHGCKVM